MYYPVEPHTGIMANPEDMDAITGNKRPRLTPEERRDRDRERTRRYRAMLTEERKREIREMQRIKVAERRMNFNDDKRNIVRSQNAKRARERRAERKMAMVLAGVHTQKPLKRPSKRAINDKRSRALQAVREATFGVFDTLVPTLGKARANRAAANAAAAAAANSSSSSNLNNQIVVSLTENEGQLLEDLDMDEEMPNLHQLPSSSVNIVNDGHLLGHDDTDSEDEGIPLPRPAVLPMAGQAPGMDVYGTAGNNKKRRKVNV